MKVGYAEQYDKTCIILEEGDEIEHVIEKAEIEDAVFQEGPDPRDNSYVVQFPNRPKELYSENALRKSFPV